MSNDLLTGTIKALESLESDIQKELKASADKLLIKIKDRIRRGYGVVSEDGEISNQQRLKPLAESTKRMRRKEGLPTKSNLTFTGQMIDSITYRVNKGSIVFYFKNEQARQKHDWVKDERPFFNLTRAEYKEAVAIIERVAAEFIKKLK